MPLSRTRRLLAAVVGPVAGFLLVPPHCSLAAEEAAAVRPDHPNVIFILADDLGYGDVGVLYQNSRSSTQPSFATPNLDALAASGMILRQHYTAAPVCAPARASLLTGLDQGHCGVRDNQFDKALQPGLTLGSMLQQAGYHTATIGKWGLAGAKNKRFPAHPLRRGFDEFFGFLPHNAGHVYYHDAKHPLMENLEDVTAKYENIYSTDLFTARAKRFIVQHEKEHPKQPFFLYLAYTAVHNALQVPAGPYPEGKGLHGGMQWPLKATPETRDSYIYPAYAQKPWTEPMKRYATMARRLDDGVADVLQTLKDLHIDQDTLVVFTSDNGPANEGGADPRLFDSWGPFDGFKRDCWEGGVREPTFVAWAGHIKAGQVSDVPSGQWDWMPTLAEVAGLPAPAHSDGVSLLPTLLGKGKQRSRGFLYGEYFFNDKWPQPAADDVARRKHAGRGQQQFVRIGDFVGVRTDIKSPTDPLRVYDVMKDPHEDHDLAGEARNAEIVRRMTELLVTARRPNASAKRPYDEVAMPAVEKPAGAAGVVEGKLTRETYTGSWPWTPDFEGMTATETGSVDGLALPGGDGTYGVAYKGYVSVPADGAYTFTVAADGGVQMWIHEAHVFDAEQAAAAKPETQTVQLAKGRHPIRLYYRHPSGTAAVLRLSYSGPGVAEQAVPAAAFSANGER